MKSARVALILDDEKQIRRLLRLADDMTASAGIYEGAARLFSFRFRSTAAFTASTKFCEAGPEDCPAGPQCMVAGASRPTGCELK